MACPLRRTIFFDLKPSQRVLPLMQHKGLYLELSIKGSTQNPLCKVLQTILLWCNGSTKNPLWSFYQEPFTPYNGANKNPPFYRKPFCIPRVSSRTRPRGSTKNLFIFPGFNLEPNQGVLPIQLLYSKGFIYNPPSGFYQEPFYFPRVISGREP